MSDSDNHSHRQAGDLDISTPPRAQAPWHYARWGNWLLVVALCLFSEGLLWTIQGADSDFAWMMVIVPLVILCAGLAVARQFVVKRGMLTWMRLASAPARAMARGDTAEAERQLRTALDRARRFSPIDHRRGLMLGVLAMHIKNQGRHAEAKSLFDESVEILSHHRHAYPMDYFIALNNLAILFIHLRDHPAAQSILEKVLDLTVVRQMRTRDDDKTAFVSTAVIEIEFVLHLNLVFLFIEMRELTEASAHMDEANAIFADLPPRRQAHYRDHYRGIRALLLLALGQFADAASQLDRAVNPDYPACLRVRAKLHLVRLEFADAERLLRKYLDLETKKGTLHRPELRDCTLDLANSLFGQAKHDEAFTALQEARAIVADFALAPDAPWRNALEAWLQHAQDLGRTDAATSLTAELQKLPAAWEHAITISDRLRVRPHGKL